MENIEKYQALTKDRDWAGIFGLNGLTIASYGTNRELRVLGDYLQDDETVFALVSGIMPQTETSNDSDFGSNTWLAVLTNERVLCLDHALMTSSVDTQSVRLNKIQAVSASQGWLFGKITIDLGARLIVIDNCLKTDVKIFADLANKLIREFESEPENPASNSFSISQEIAKLSEMHNDGILTDDEFSNAKAKFIDKL